MNSEWLPHRLRNPIYWLVHAPVQLSDFRSDWETQMRRFATLSVATILPVGGSLQAIAEAQAMAAARDPYGDLAELLRHARELIGIDDKLMPGLDRTTYADAFAVAAKMWSSLANVSGTAGRGSANAGTSRKAQRCCAPIVHATRQVDMLLMAWDASAVGREPLPGAASESLRLGQLSSVRP